MEFVVVAGDTEEHFTGRSRWSVENGGVLVVYTHEGRRRTYSPAGWWYVEDRAPTEPTAPGRISP